MAYIRNNYKIKVASHYSCTVVKDHIGWLDIFISWEVQIYIPHTFWSTETKVNFLQQALIQQKLRPVKIKSSTNNYSSADESQFNFPF